MGVPFLHRLRAPAGHAPAQAMAMAQTTCDWPLSLVGADGPQLLTFRIIGLGETAPRGSGLFIYARRGSDGQWQALYIGETSDLRHRLSFNEIAADALMSGATDIHVLQTKSDTEERRQTCEQMIRINRPTLNETASLTPTRKGNAA